MFNVTFETGRKIKLNMTLQRHSVVSTWEKPEKSTHEWDISGNSSLLLPAKSLLSTKWQLTESYRSIFFCFSKTKKVCTLNSVSK